MDIRNNNLVNFSSNGIKANKKQLNSNKNMSFSGVPVKDLPKTPVIKPDVINKALDEVQKGVNSARKEFPKVTEGDLSPDAAPLFYKGFSKFFRHFISPITEKYYTKPHVRDPKDVKKLGTCESISSLVGNSAKELTCMIFYPLMTLTNQDMSTEKKRFVGMYDFFVTCFSLTGALGFALAKKQTDYLPNKLMAKYEKQGFSGISKAKKGSAFIFNIALQTLLCKRILAPAISPKFAAAVRKKWEKDDAQKAAAAGVVVQEKDDKKTEKTATTHATKPSAKVADKPAAKAEEKTAVKTIEKQAEKVAEKSAAKAEEKPATKTAEKPAEKVADKPAAKAEEKPATKTVEKPAEKVADKPAAKTEEKSTTKPAEKSAEKVADKPVAKAEEKSAAKSADKPEQDKNLFAVYKKSTEKKEKTA